MLLGNQGCSLAVVVQYDPTLPSIVDEYASGCYDSSMCVVATLRPSAVVSLAALRHALVAREQGHFELRIPETDGLFDVLQMCVQTGSPDGVVERCPRTTGT